MRKRALLLVAVVVTLAVAMPPPAAGHGGWQTYIVSAHDADTENGTVAWFTVDNRTEANPSLPVHPNETVILHLVNLGERNHTLAIGEPIGEQVGPVAPGEEASVSFRVPADATGAIPYRDPAWDQRGMRGALQVQDAATRQDTPGLGLPPLLAALAASVVIVRMSPRARR